MTAHQLIDSIFSQVHAGLPANTRRITQGQFDFLLDLIRKSAHAAAIENGEGGSVVWTPSGGVGYVFTAPPPGRKTGTLKRVRTELPVGMARLF